MLESVLAPQGYDTPEGQQPLHPALCHSLDPTPSPSPCSPSRPRTLLPGQPFQRASWPRPAAGHLDSTADPHHWILLAVGRFCPGQPDTSPSLCILVYSKPKLCLRPGHRALGLQKRSDWADSFQAKRMLRGSRGSWQAGSVGRGSPMEGHRISWGGGLGMGVRTGVTGIGPTTGAAGVACGGSGPVSDRV